MEKLRHFELGDRGLERGLSPCIQGKAQPQMAEEARVLFSEGVCMQRRALPWSPHLSTAPGETEREQTVDKQQVP